MYKFPENFLWGAATSAHQVEGNNKNDWTEWESSPERVADLVGRGLNPGDYISGEACDHYRRFKSDFDIAKELGHNAHRFSIEWSRIEPEEGKFNEREIEHYREVIKALCERGIEPFVTLWHWTFPVWIAKRGGWESPQCLNYFLRFCERVIREFRNDVRYWVVLNEPEYWLGHAYFTKRFPAPRHVSAFSVYRALARTHQTVYRALKNIDASLTVGIVESTGWIRPAPLRWLLHDFRNFSFPWLVRGSFDFFGLNYYRSAPLIGGTRGETSDIGWEIYPEGLYHMVCGAYRRFQKPVIITENGIADASDTKREAYIRSHVLAIGKAISEGADVRGYFHWSLLDNFEWDSGFGPRFGLIEVDYKTQERKIRSSAWEYKRIIKANAI